MVRHGLPRTQAEGSDGLIEAFTPGPPTRPMAEIDAAILRSKHSVTKARSALWCNRCSTGVLLSKQHAPQKAVTWLDSDCWTVPAVVDGVVPHGFMSMRPMPLHTRDEWGVMVGGTLIHHSHRLWHYRGAVCCAACGRHAAFTVSPALQRVCPGCRATPYATRTWLSFSSMSLPAKTPSWPDTAGFWLRLV